ncbi:Rz-like lysis system protein LysB [Rahnella ecdela]|uniref:Transcriptional regulator n=1 Tax=Rahnella ecdela TaxID=2816250 RepID=A0ABS6LB95_9GAMM|nr:Rz-like lysis system protein LysB [Rahnella ecdela]MBU9844203.1 transcriptional regulator [Rahnella ecdela]
MRLLPVLLAGMVLLIAILLLSNRSLQHDFNIVGLQRDALTVQLQQREQLITALNLQMRQREQAELALREDLSTANQVMQNREKQRQRSLHENLQTRQWADSGLPDDISRLHQRPAFSSASDYLHWLSTGQLMPDTRQQTGHE